MSTSILLTASLLLASGNEADWRWSKEHASLVYSIERHLNDATTEITRSPGYGTPLTVRITLDQKETVYFHAHWHTCFTRADNILYLAEYRTSSTGCKVHAIDLNSGKYVWKSALQGIGPIGHSKYFNSVNIDSDGKTIVIHGNESSGRYIEHLDTKTGKTLKNKQLESEKRN